MQLKTKMGPHRFSDNSKYPPQKNLAKTPRTPPAFRTTVHLWCVGTFWSNIVFSFAASKIPCWEIEDFWSQHLCRGHSYPGDWARAWVNPRWCRTSVPPGSDPTLRALVRLLGSWDLSGSAPRPHDKPKKANKQKSHQWDNKVVFKIIFWPIRTLP